MDSSLAFKSEKRPGNDVKKNESQKDLISLLKDNLQFMTEGQKRRFYYYLSCNYLSVLDYESLELIMREWQPMKNDYDGIVYKALVTAEFKTISEASIMVGEALDRISKVLLKESSEELRSKKAALEFLSSFYEGEKRPKTPQEYSFLVLANHSGVSASIKEEWIGFPVSGSTPLPFT